MDVDDVFVEDVEDETVTKTSVDVDRTRHISLTGSPVRTEHFNPLTCYTPTILNVKTNLSRKRKMSPSSGQESPGQKLKLTPLAARKGRNSEKIKHKSNLITNHFKFFSLARSRGDGQAVEVAAVGQGGREGGGGGTVQNARAKFGSGQARVGEVGKTKQHVTLNTIGPDQTAAATLSNQGQTNIQLMRQRFERGNASDSNKI